jgi:hypothetical protein
MTRWRPRPALSGVERVVTWSPKFRSVLAVVLIGLGTFAGACATAPDDAARSGESDETKDDFGNASGNYGHRTSAALPACAPNCADFPEAPIMDGAGPTPVPPNAAKLFGDADKFGTAGVCVIEPALSAGDLPGAMFPKNWLRPRFRFAPLAGEDLWEIRLRVETEANALVAYTTRTTWELPRDIWQALSVHAVDQPITVTIRGINSAAPERPSGTRGTFSIAPVEAPGKLVYWATTSSDVRPDTSKLVGFAVGDEGVIDALTVAQVGQREIRAAGGRDLRGMNDDPKGVAPGAVECIGCHVSTPDGEAVAFTDHWPWNNVLASVEPGSAGLKPAYLTPGAALLLGQPWLGMQSFSAAHWQSGDRIVVATYSPRNADHGGVGFADSAPYPSHADRLAWFDLETSATFDVDPMQGDKQQVINEQVAAQFGKAFGVVELRGETRSAGTPSFSHDGTRVAYTSADATQDGTIGPSQEADVHVVPFNDRAGGAVEPLVGASEPGVLEYYPAFSADDRLVAFTRDAQPDGSRVYYRPKGEVYVVPAKGGAAVRLLANDPPACTGETSPGVVNSWPKWSPSVVSPPGGDDSEFGQATFYWLIFSSARAYPGQFEVPANQYSAPDHRASQLYMTGIITLGNGEILTYPAVYLWNQDAKTSNLTPAWDEFKIPPVPGPD